MQVCPCSVIPYFPRMGPLRTTSSQNGSVLVTADRIRNSVERSRMCRYIVSETLLPSPVLVYADYIAAWFEKPCILKKKKKLRALAIYIRAWYMQRKSSFGKKKKSFAPEYTKFISSVAKNTFKISQRTLTMTPADLHVLFLLVK